MGRIFRFFGFWFVSFLAVDFITTFVFHIPDDEGFKISGWISFVISFIKYFIIPLAQKIQEIKDKKDREKRAKELDQKLKESGERAVREYYEEKKQEEERRKSEIRAIYAKEIYNLTPYEFEEYVAELLREEGCEDVDTTPKSGDYGADIIGFKDGEKFCVQCKYYASPVGVKAVQEIVAAKTYYDCEKAYVYSVSGYTPAANEMAKKVGVKLINLEDDTTLNPSLDEPKDVCEKVLPVTTEPEKASNKLNTFWIKHRNMLSGLIMILIIAFCVLIAFIANK